MSGKIFQDIKGKYNFVNIIVSGEVFKTLKVNRVVEQANIQRIGTEIPSYFVFSQI